MVYQWRAVLDEHRSRTGGDTRLGRLSCIVLANKQFTFSRVMMTECYSSIEMVMRYYGNETHEGAQMPFNFQFIERIKMDSNANDYKAAIDYWWSNMPKGRTANWVVIIR